MPPLTDDATAPRSADAEREFQIQRTRQTAERLEDRLGAVRDALQACARRMDDWLEVAQIRHYFARRAGLRGPSALCTAWSVVEAEAMQAIDLERRQIAALAQREQLLELSAQCAWSDVDDAQRASPTREDTPLVFFESES